MKGRSTSWTTGLGTVEVSGRSRVPSPPTRISACMTRTPAGPRFWLCKTLPTNRLANSSSSNALIDKAGLADRGAVDEVAPVHEQVPGHPLAHAAPVQLGE